MKHSTPSTTESDVMVTDIQSVGVASDRVTEPVTSV